MKLMKTFDMSDMPPDIQDIWTNYACDNGNRGYISFWVENDMLKDGDMLVDDEDDRFHLSPLANWLLEQGAELNEHILVEYDW